ncbi:hypothetical protein ES703_25324 [subsurface metagenome]
MRNQRSFSLEFKRQVVEELLSGESRPAQLCPRYNISSSILYHWKKQYCHGKFDNEHNALGLLYHVGLKGYYLWGHIASECYLLGWWNVFTTLERD